MPCARTNIKSYNLYPASYSPLANLGALNNIKLYYSELKLPLIIPTFENEKKNPTIFLLMIFLNLRVK